MAQLLEEATTLSANDDDCSLRQLLNTVAILHEKCWILLPANGRQWLHRLALDSYVKLMTVPLTQKEVNERYGDWLQQNGAAAVTLDTRVEGKINVLASSNKLCYNRKDCVYFGLTTGSDPQYTCFFADLGQSLCVGVNPRVTEAGCTGKISTFIDSSECMFELLSTVAGVSIRNLLLGTAYVLYHELNRLKGYCSVY